MARSVDGPWFRAGKNTWYATVGPRKVSLRVQGAANRTAAVRAWHRLMADLPPEAEANAGGVGRGAATAAPAAGGSLSVGQAADRFLSAMADNLKPNTVRLYRNDVGQFCDRLGTMPVAGVTADDIARWLVGLDVKPTTKGIMLRSVGSFFGWCVRHGLCGGNPVRLVPKPKGKSRSKEAVVSAADHAKLTAVATDNFRLVLDVLYATGCRPGEAAALTVENTDLAAGVGVLDTHKCDRTGKPRLVFLPAELCERLRALGRGRGPLLRTTHGNGWTGRSITQAMRRVRTAAGVKAIAYGYRHGYATEALARGVPDATVAALLGHSGTAMLHRHYSHLGSRADVLRQAAARVRP